MPKISTNEVKIYHSEINKAFKVEVMYNSDLLFYVVIEPDFNEVFDHLSDANLKEYFAEKKYKSGNYKRIVRDETEVGVLAKIKKFYEFLVSRSIERRDVIIVFFNPRNTTQYNTHAYNDKHPQIGIQFGLTYAVETTSGAKKIYNIWKTSPGVWGAQDKQIRQEINLWNQAATIIDDTPENRLFLEGLYSAMENLVQKLKDVTKTPEDLLQLIANNTRILPEPEKKD